MNYCFLFYSRVTNNDNIETTINTLKKYSDAEIHVYSDTDEFEHSHKVADNRVIGRRATCKVECLLDFMGSLEEDDQILVADVDLYFCGDPFTAFEQEFDLGVTIRKHRRPVNGGIFYLRNNEKTEKLIVENICQAHHPTWLTYRKLKKDTYGLDWTVNQNFLNACWQDRKNLNLKIVDVGEQYNYCPESKKLMKEAYLENKAITLHLKSRLKLCIYEGWLPDAVANHPTDIWNWQKACKKQ